MSDLIERLRTVQANAATMDSVRLAADCIEQIELLIEERDEARVEVCRLMVAGGFSVHENETEDHVAYERGWDCFKEKP
jgi:hypothetical protein